MEKIAIDVGIEAAKIAGKILLKKGILGRNININLAGNILIALDSLVPYDDALLKIDSILSKYKYIKGGIKYLKYNDFCFPYNVSINYEFLPLEDFIIDMESIEEVETTLFASSIRIYLYPSIKDTITLSKDDFKKLLMVIYWFYRDKLEPNICDEFNNPKCYLFYKIRFYDNKIYSKIIKKMSEEPLIKNRSKFNIRLNEIILFIDDSKIIELFLDIIYNKLRGVSNVLRL